MLSTSSSLAHPKMASNCKFGCCAGAEGIEKHMLTIRVWGTGHEQHSKDAEEGKERVEEEEWGGEGGRLPQLWLAQMSGYKYRIGIAIPIATGQNAF